MLTTVATALYLFAPAFAANATPVLVRHVPGLRRWNTAIAPQWLGANKTWRGLILGVMAAACVGAAQGSAGAELSIATAALHARISTALQAGVLLGFGALLGDMAKSAYKRRSGIAPGRPLPIIDSVDYVWGGLLLLAWVYIPPASHVVVLLLIGPILSLGANAFSYRMGWKEVWW